MKKKQNKCNRINFRCSNEDWIFFQTLREKGVNISAFITSSVKMTDRYKKFDNLINGSLCKD